ncbi:MAG: hypothetical protein KDA72_18940 [Planctomycetales bacterium]|nr:hypothetical protein [Planctomycetales bacterium]
MRSFNKIFIIALPRCATVSLCDALGLLGIPTAHLGCIYGEATGEHFHPQRLSRIYQQISCGDYDLDILRECRGLADYPACCPSVFQQLDRQFPGSLFVNVRRDDDLVGWLQSVERQFVGLQLVKQNSAASADEQHFMQVMLSLRAMTFGQSQFDPEVFLRAYHAYQRQVEQTFAARPEVLLQFDDTADLEMVGFEKLCKFLECPNPGRPFPNSNTHSQRPQAAFMQALIDGTVTSLTGIQTTGMPLEHSKSKGAGLSK